MRRDLPGDVVTRWITQSDLVGFWPLEWQAKDELRLDDLNLLTDGLAGLC
jgi:hypothetical protein